MHVLRTIKFRTIRITKTSKKNLKSARSQKKSGFTLLELLVVVSIIGLLLAMGTVAFATAQQRGRDSRRRADIQQMQKGFEQYYADNGAYSDCATMDDSAYFPGGLPTDPRPGNSYSCTGSATAYCACALLEDTGSGNASDTSCTFASGGNYICVSNLQ